MPSDTLKERAKNKIKNVKKAIKRKVREEASNRNRGKGVMTVKEIRNLGDTPAIKQDRTKRTRK